MAYGLKYQIAYSRISGGNTYINIYEDSYSGAVTNLQASGNPLEIFVSGDVGNIYSGTIGTGAVINVLATPLTLTDLFTSDPQKYKVLVYHNSTIIWQGFINTGIYYEELNLSKNTLLSIKANDGMAILDMLPYRPDASTLYTGFNTIANVFTNVFNKLNLTFNYRWGLMDYRVVDYADNPLLYLTVNQENYIDENGKPMTCRKVVDTIIQSLSLRMFFRGDTIYLIDPICMHDTSLGQAFNVGWGETIETFPGGFLDISNKEIAWYQTGITTDIISPINELTIKYDPYTTTDLQYDFSKSENIDNEGTWSGPYGLEPNQYYINNSIQYKNIVTDGSILQQAIKRADDTGQTHYLKLQHSQYVITGNPGIARISFPISSIHSDSNIFLKVTAEYYCNTRGYDNIFDTSIASDEITYIETSIGYRIGGGPDTSIVWDNIKVISDYTLLGAEVTQSNIADKWVKSYNYWPYGDLEQINSDGSINVFIYGKYDTGSFTTTDKNVLVRNVQVEVVNANGDKIENNGTKFTALKPLTSNYIIDPNTIDLLHGTGPFGSSKGAFINYLTNTVSPGIYRGLEPSTGTLYPFEYHVAQSFISQYNQPRFVISGCLNVNAHHLDTQNYLIKWSNHFNNKAFYIANCTYNDKYENMMVAMVECASTRENITIL